MKKIIIIVCIIGLVILSISSYRLLQAKAEIVYKAEVDPLTHPQRVWLGALEWCESHGVVTAINPNDKDNTPSYYSYQFKPGTFRSYGEKYGLIEKEQSNIEINELMKDYELTVKIMEQMILDKDITANQWRYSLFPGCVAKLGTPPRSYPL